MMADDLFTFERRVGFGECDPARIFFSPRAADYAMEAVELWYDSVLGVSWGDLVKRHDLEARFLSMECDYLRPLTAGQVIQVRVSVVEMAGSTITLRATAELGPDEPAFSVCLVTCFVERSHGGAIPIPEVYRERVESYRRRCADPAAVVAGKGRAKEVPVRDDSYLLSLRRKAAAPFTRQRRVLYGECGVSGTMYLPKLVECAIERLGEWYEWCLGISWLEQNIRKRGVPFINIRFDCLRPISSGEMISMVVRIPRLGKASIGYQVIGYDDKGEPCFDAQMAACYITEESGSYQPIPFPDQLRQRIIAYQNACDSHERQNGQRD
jgi:acyl-CoA thioesterase FadM